MPPQSQPEPLPVFTSLGHYEFATEIHSAVPGSGLTVVGNRAFYSTVRLNGALPKKLDGVAMEYRFEVRTTDATGGSPGGWSPIPLTSVARTEIGQLQRWAPDSPTDPNPVKTRVYTVNGTAGPHEVVAAVTADGWIKVPQESDVFSAGGFFVPNGNMVNLQTPELAAFGSKNMAGVEAGESTTAHGATLAANRHFSLRMMVRKAGETGNGAPAGTCHHVAINNTGYDNVQHHPSWAGFTDPPSSLGVCLLDVQQLILDGCSGITDALDVLLTTAHPNLGVVHLRMRGPGGPYAFNLPAAVPGERFGTATPAGWSVGDLEPCAYLIALSAEILLTDGDQSAGSLEDEIPICKTSKKRMRIG